MGSGRSQQVCNIREEGEGDDVRYPQGASTAAAVELLPDADVEVPHVEEREEEGGHVEDLRAEQDQSARDRGRREGGAEPVTDVGQECFFPGSADQLTQISIGSEPVGRERVLKVPGRAAAG